MVGSSGERGRRSSKIAREHLPVLAYFLLGAAAVCSLFGDTALLCRRLLVEARFLIRACFGLGALDEAAPVLGNSSLRLQAA